MLNTDIGNTAMKHMTFEDALNEAKTKEPHNHTHESLLANVQKLLASKNADITYYNGWDGFMEIHNIDKYDKALKAEIKQLFKGVSKYRYTTPDAQTARINYEL